MITVLHCSNMHFFTFFASDRDLMTFIYELYQYSLDIYRICENELPVPMSSFFKVIIFIYHPASWVVNNTKIKQLCANT